MGVFQNALLKGTKNKCANLYVEEVVRRFRSAVRSNFPHSPKTLFNIHNELASNLFSELDIFLRIKNNYSIAEIDAHFFHAEAIGLDKACSQLNIDYEELVGLMSDVAMNLARSKYEKELSVQDNFAKIKGGKELKGKSVMFRSTVLSALELIEQENLTMKRGNFDDSKVKKYGTRPIVEIINKDNVKKPGTSSKKKRSEPIIEVINTEKVKKPGASSKSIEVTNFVPYEEFVKKAQKKSQERKQLSAENREAAWHFSVPLGGWTWFCSYHNTYGIGDDEEEVLFMAGAHMHYFRISDDCQVVTKEWNENR